MPTYHARGISAHLGISPLADTITPKIALKKGDVARKQCEDAESRLLGSTMLREERVDFPGDELGLGLHWVGNAPFMQVQHSITNTNTIDEPLNGKPQALSLHVWLSDKSFVSGLANTKTNLKIEVLFNGKLANCSFIPVHDVRSGIKSFHQIFAGTRTDFLAERPWVIFSPKATAGELDKTGRSLSVMQRWQQLSYALQAEAYERGTDKHGRIPPSAEFLNALASMEMPTQVTCMHKPGDKQFGVIDLVVSAGDGMKVTRGTGYLKAPRRLQDTKFALTVPRELAGQSSQAEKMLQSREKDQFTLDDIRPKDGAQMKTSRVFESPLRMQQFPNKTSFTTPIREPGSPNSYFSLTSCVMESTPSRVYNVMSPPQPQSRPTRANHIPTRLHYPPPPTSLASCAQQPCYFSDSVLPPPVMSTACARPIQYFPTGPSILSPYTKTPVEPWNLSTLPSCSSPHSSSLRPSPLLPPRGLFTVPTKPKTNKASSPKKAVEVVKELEGHNGQPDCSPTSRKPFTSKCPVITANTAKGIGSPVAKPNWLEQTERTPGEVMSCHQSNSSAKVVQLLETHNTLPTATNLQASEAASSSPLSSVPKTPTSSSAKSCIADPSPDRACSPQRRHNQDPASSTSGISNTSIKTISNAPRFSLPLASPEVPQQEDEQSQLRPNLQSTPKAPPVSPLTSPGYSTSSCPSTASPTKGKTEPASCRKKRKFLRSPKKDTPEQTPISSRHLLPVHKKDHRTTGPHPSILDDHSLNKNCVIAYAGCQKDYGYEDGGQDSANQISAPMLRQVKGERQGVFREDYVVSAMRFFVFDGIASAPYAADE